MAAQFVLDTPETVPQITRCVVVNVHITGMHDPDTAQVTIEYGCAHEDLAQPGGFFIDRIETVKLTMADINWLTIEQELLRSAMTKAAKVGTLNP